MTRVHVLGNPAARGGSDRLDEVLDALRRRDIEPVTLVADSPDAAAESAAEAVADGASRLICVGGDGSVHLAVGAVAGSDTVLGIVALGTGNDFARALGLIDGDLDSQVERALADPVAIDAIRTEHGWVATVATLGFSGDVTARANALSWPRGQMRYSVATLLQLPRLRTIPLDVTVDGERVDGDATLLAVGNTTFFGGGMRICPDTSPDDGRLQLVVIGDVPRRTFLRVFPRVFSGRHVDHAAVTTAVGRVVTVDGTADVWADGELLGPLPITLEVVPGALQVAGARTDA